LLSLLLLVAVLLLQLQLLLLTCCASGWQQDGALLGALQVFQSYIAASLRATTA
jgi:hypothetical protein